ncbi:MAG: Ribosome maturation factor RimM [Firmicutes bacterium]|nr:Ribosome maturation factor RimM [Bacillota bacterium]MBT9158027.1 Ribosome maturation factor RimM [Bacillota bacterium]
MEPRLICIALVTGVHGIKGEVKVKSFSDHPERFARLPGSSLLWRKDGATRPITVVAVKTIGRFFVLTLQGVTLREKAQEFVMGELLVPESEVLPLPPGSYYTYQLMGMRVIDENGLLLGSVRDVLHLGSNDAYVVGSEKGDILIPALKSVVRTIDVEKKEMHVTLPPGLVDAE